MLKNVLSVQSKVKIWADYLGNSNIKVWNVHLEAKVSWKEFLIELTLFIYGESVSKLESDRIFVCVHHFGSRLFDSVEEYSGIKNCFL